MLSDKGGSEGAGGAARVVSGGGKEGARRLTELRELRLSLGFFPGEALVFW